MSPCRTTNWNMKRSRKAELFLCALSCVKPRNASHPLRASVSSSVAWGWYPSMLPHQFCTLLEGGSCPSPHGVPSAVPGPEQVLTQHRQCDHWPRGCADRGYCHVHFGVRQPTCVSSERFFSWGGKFTISKPRSLARLLTSQGLSFIIYKRG